MTDEFQDEILTEKWLEVAPELRLPQLENLERDGVSIQCINSSDFVVGKQTNFNGPVTIITCADALKRESDESEGHKEKLVIRDQILSRSAAMKVQKMAAEKEKAKEGELQNQEKSKMAALKVPALVFAGLLTTAFVAAPFLLTKRPAAKALPKCIPLQKSACIYFGFDWGGSPITERIKRLETPVPYVVISQTDEDYCYEVDKCLEVVQFHQRNRSEEAACNFLLGGDGNAYEDRGWDRENSLEHPAKGKTLQLCFMGNFTEEDYPTYPQLLAAKALIRVGIDNNYISKDYMLTSSNATSPRYPLPSIYKIIKKWPNFHENPFGKG